MKKIQIILALIVLVLAVSASAQFAQAPTNFIAGYTSDGTNLIIPITELEYLTVGQASASTGDIRQIVFAIQETIYQKWNSIPASNRSSRINVSRIGSAYSNRISYTYTYRADTAPDTLILLPE